MGIIVKESGGKDIEPIPEGVYMAVCYGVIDLGHQFSPAFNNENRKALIQWELPDCRGDFERDGQKMSLPRAISKRYTVSLSEKSNLRRDLESWRGRRFTPVELTGFDLKNVLGASCQLQVVHDTTKEGRTVARVGAIMALSKGMKPAKAENPLAWFSFEEAGERPELPDGLPDWVCAIIKESREWRTAYAATPASAATATTSSSAPAPAPAAVDAVEDEEPLPF